MGARRATSVVAVGSAVSLALVCLVGCGATSGGGGNPSLLGSPSASPSSASRQQKHAAPRASLQGLLDKRAAAVRNDDEHRFLAAVAPGVPAFLAQQRQLFANLQTLPVADLSFHTDGSRILRSLTLDGFDTQPEVGPAGFGVERRDGRLLVVPPTPAERGTDPWDLAAVGVRRGANVLAVFDRASSARVDDVISVVSRGISDVSRVVPGGWGGTAVVYVFEDPTVLAAYARVPGGNLGHLGGISFPVRGGAHGSLVVGSRLALLPGALHAGSAELARIVRHELTHVALGTRADGVPPWLSEGIAEYVAALPVPPAKRRIATVALRAAEAGTVELPAAASFNDAAQALHYSVAWMACDYLAHRHGGSVLWRLLDAMRSAHVGRAGVGQDAVLRAVVGLDSTQLADKASARIRTQFGSRGP